MRQRIYTIVTKATPGDRLSQVYDVLLVLVAFAGIVPLMFKGTSPALELLDVVTVYLLFADYVLRWICHDYAGRLKGPWAFVAYPFTPYAIVLLLSLLPSMGILGPGFRMLRLLRIFVIVNYSDNFRRIAKVFKKERKTLMAVLYIAIFYIFVSALVMFTYEPETFSNFFEALYWSTTALTTVGYGDLSPVSEVGRLISMVSSLFGIAVIALPAGIVTAGFVDEINSAKNQPVEAVAAPLAKGPLVHVTPKVKRYLWVMAIGVLMDHALDAAAQWLDLPLWLDATGTAYAAILLEPAAGLVVGLINNVDLAVAEFGVGSLLYYSVSASVALVAGLCIRKRGRFAPGRIVAALPLAILLSALLSTVVQWVINGGGPPATHWEHVYYLRALGAGVPHLPACFIGVLAVKALDMLVSAAIVAVACLVTPKALRADALRRGE